MDINLIRASIDSAMTLIANDSYGAISQRNRLQANEALQIALDETYAHGENFIAALFVYQHKNTGEVKVRWQDDAVILEEDKAWNHIGTLEPRGYINALLREYPSLVRVMKGESA